MDLHNPTPFYGDSPLHVAVRQGQIEDVREILIQQQVDVNILHSKHETPLHLACSKNDSPIVQLLVAFGADPYIRDYYNISAYGRSGFNVQLLMNKLLFGHGLRLWIDGPVQADKESPLHTAVRLGRLDDIQRIIEEKIVDINDTNANHETPLHLACAFGHKHIVHILISNRADMYKKDIFNNAPIHRAVSQGHTDTMDYLITDCACNPKIKGYQGRTLLHFACGVGNFEFITTLIEKYGISPMATDAVNQTPLHIAASHGQEEVVRLLITKYSLVVDCRNNGNLSPLHLACYCGHVSVVKMLLLEYKANLNARDKSGSTPFLKVVMGGNSVLVQLMIKYFNQDPLSTTNDNSGNTPLHMACWGGHEDLSRLLITKYNCPVDIKNKKKETLLHIACSSGHNGIVKMLISEFKADATQRDRNNDTAVSKAAEGGHVETVQALITELGCSPQITGYDGRSLLHDACWSGSIKLAEMLIIDFNLDVLSADDSGNTPLHMACWGGHEELARLLITKYNCPVDIKNKKNETPLCVAVLNGHICIVQELITEFGCSPQVKGVDGRSLLHYACDEGQTKLAMILITDFKLDPLSADDSGNTPLHMACLGGHEELARLLITKYNSPVNVKNKKKETPLHKACALRHLSVVRMLVSEFKADKDARNHQNYTPLCVAVVNGYTSIVQALINEFDCSPHVKGFGGRSLLHYACKKGHTKLAMILITDFDLHPLLVDDRRNTPLHMACWYGHEELARLLINKYNCPFDVKNKNKQTPLHMACFSGHLSVSKVLVSECMQKGNKRFCNALDKDNNTPLDLLIKKGDAKAVHVLSTKYGLKPHVRGVESKPLLYQLAAGGFTAVLQELISKFNYDPASSDEDGNTVLHIAAQHGQYKIAKFVINNHSYQCPIDHRNCQGLTALHCACMCGHARIVKLIANKALGDKDEKALVDDCGNTLLHIAAQYGQYEIAKLLFADFGNQCPIDQRNSHRQTALHCACIGGHTRVAKLLVDNKADITIRDKNGDTPLKKAFLTGHKLIILELFNFNLHKIDSKLLLQVCEHGYVNLMDVLLSDFHLDPSSVLDDQGNKPIHIAALRGHKQVVTLLVKKYNCPVDVKNKDKKTPLHIACSHGHHDISKVLLSLGGNKRFCNALDNDSNTPLDLLIKRGDTKTVHIFSTEYGLKPHIRGVESEQLLHQLAAGGFTAVLQELISKFNYDPASSDEDGNTVLHIAAQHGQYKIAKFVINNHSNQCPIDHRNCRGLTALHYACMHGYARIVKLIVNKALGDKDEKALVDEDGNTLLHIAAQHGRHEIAELLFTDYSNQCPINHRNSRGQTALHCACIGGHTRVAKLLVANKADITVRDEDGDTPLKKAFLTGHECTFFELFNSNLRKIDDKLLLHVCERGYINLIDVLLSDFHLDPSSVLDDEGNKPIHIAALLGHEQIVTLLVKKYNCPVNDKNRYKQTPLHLACSHGHLDVSKVLVSESMLKSDKRFYNALDEDNNTPLDLLIKKGDAKAVHVLSTKYGLKPHVRGVESKPLLYQLAAGGFSTVLQELISKFNHDPASSDEDGNTVLHIAAQHGQYKIAKFVINNHSYQCPIDHRNCQGLSAFHYACMHDRVRIAKLIANKVFGDKDEKASIHECGNTLLHIAAQHGQHEIAELLIADYGNQCPIDHRNSQGQTALHCACIGGHTRIAKFLIASKADITIRDEDGDTPLKKACLMGHELTMFELFNSNLRTIDSKLLRQICERGSSDLIYILLSDFHLDSSSVLDDQGNKAIHVAALRGHKQVIALLVKKYKCPIDSRNLNGQTPLHLLCSQLPIENGHALIRMCVSELKADMTIKDNNGDQPIHAAVQAGHTSTVVSLILDYHVSPNSRGFKNRSLLHYALAKGHTSTAKTLIEDFHLSLHCVDEDGNTPLHLSSLVGQIESLRFLLYKYHAPVYVRNKAGKTALDLATEDSTRKAIREYVKSEHKRIQHEYEELRIISSQKYSGQQAIIRVFVLGNPESGKSTLVESLKRKGIFSSLFPVTEANVPPHTAGIVPSVHQSKEAGRLLYYDFAGDQEYYSSHAAILEIVSRSTVGSNVFLVVANLTKDDPILQNEIGYWLSFISYHGKALSHQCKLKVIVVLSHLDRLSVADSDRKVKSVRHCLQTHINQCNKVKFDAEIISSNCRSPRSSRSVASILQKISKDTPPCSISYEASLLHGLLEKDFGNVVACKFQNLLSSIEEIGIYLPSSADALHPIVRELHDIGLLMLIGRNEDELENYLLLLNPSSLTNEVHEKLFSSSASKKLGSLSSIGPHFANMGILPESYLANILPEHITKDCLVQLQYCQEFNHAEVGLDYSVTSNDASDCSLLYFPALCKLDSKKSSWHSDPKFTFSIGWYAECREKFDYFPARFLHVLLLRLAYAFALPIINRNPTNSSNEVSAYSRRCTMWKNGIHWRMEEGVEYIVEVVNDNKGISVITKYKENSEKWATVLGKIIDKAMQAKAEFCNAVSLHHFVLKSGSVDTASYSDPENLFDISDIERVIRQLDSESDLEEVLSADRRGSNSLDLHILHVLKRHSCWGRLHDVKHCITK